MTKDRKKTGGRKPGVKNRNRAELRALIEKELRARHLLDRGEEWCPIAMLAVIAQKSFNSEDYPLAVVAARECAKYMYAPLQAKRAEEEDNRPEAVDMSEIGRRFDDLMNRRGGQPPLESYLLDDQGRRLCRDPSGQFVPEVMEDHQGRRFYRDASNQWVPADRLVPKIEDKSQENQVLDLVSSSSEVVEVQ